MYIYIIYSIYYIYIHCIDNIYIYILYRCCSSHPIWKKYQNRPAKMTILDGFLTKGSMGYLSENKHIGTIVIGNIQYNWVP